MKTHALKVEKRTVLGKKLKKLRREGILPANIYGKGIKSLAIQVSLKEFTAVYKETGETGLIEISLGSEKRPALIHNLQLEFITKVPLHADFYQVNLKEKVRTMIPVVALGEAKAISEKIGLLLQPLSEIEIEALPTDLPEKIGVSVEGLTNIDDQITIADIKVPQGVSVLTDPVQVLFKITELVSKEAAEQAKQEAAQAEAAKDATKAETGAQEGITSVAGVAPKEGEASAEQKPQEKKEEKQEKQQTPIKSGQEQKPQ